MKKPLLVIWLFMILSLVSHNFLPFLKGDLYAFPVPLPTALKDTSTYYGLLAQEDYKIYPLFEKETPSLFYRDVSVVSILTEDALYNRDGWWFSLLDDPDLSNPRFLDPFMFENKGIDSFIEYFRGRGRPHFEVWLSRSNKYISMAKEIFSGYGLPEDLAYLAMIESGFNPRAYSRAKAAGIWQFIKGTARIYDLRVDWWIDERRDPEQSTHAAARYLKDLYEEFDSWPLAIVAYNAGGGRIRRTVARYKEDADIWKILNSRRLKKESRDYFPKFLAALRIVKRPEQYGFEDARSLQLFEYDKVKVPYATDIKVIADASGVTISTIKELNPGLKRWFTPPDYPDYQLKIPYGARETYLKNIAEIPSNERITFHRHRVKKNETLSHISRRYRTSIKAIMYLNGIKNPRRLRAGSKITIPVRGKKPKLARNILRES
ncbi:MAG: transglycosylase SLT domain-containing protein [Thermodesulfobacteriota bacterium]